jgi:hypothetical protein
MFLALTSCAQGEEADGAGSGAGGTGGASGDAALDNSGGGDAGGNAGSAGSAYDGGSTDASGGTAGSALDGSIDGSTDGADGSSTDAADDGAAGAPTDGGPDASDGGSDANDAATEAACTDACSLGENLCVVGGLAPCEQTPSGCNGWGSPVACASNETCVTDACVPTGPVEADVQIYIDNFCNVTIVPPSFDVATGETLQLTYHNNSVDYEADIWASYGGGYIALATGGTWAETFEYCSMPGDYTAYVDININGGPFPSCPGQRLYIYCH